jgi:hypothetical protein
LYEERLTEKVHWEIWAEAKEAKPLGDKKSGLKVVTLIATLNPVSQVLW